MMKGRGSWLGTLAGTLVSFFSGEWVLTWTPYTANGGTVVTVRSLWLSMWIYVPAFLLQTRFADGKIAVWDIRQGAADLVNTLPWVAAIIGAVYAALYTRFASQWNYLANLFNLIVQTQATLPSDDLDRRIDTLVSWKAAFIEDAQDLHLAAKPMFLVAVTQWGSEATIAERFGENTVGGAKRLEALLANLTTIRDEAERTLPGAADAIQDGSVPP